MEDIINNVPENLSHEQKKYLKEKLNDLLLDYEDVKSRLDITTKQMVTAIKKLGEQESKILFLENIIKQLVDNK